MADSASDPEVLAAIAAVKQAFATILIGFAIATTYVIILRQWLDAHCSRNSIYSFYGITNLQVYLYYRHYTKDSIFLKGLVRLTVVTASFAITADCMINTGCFLMVSIAVIREFHQAHATSGQWTP